MKLIFGIILMVIFSFPSLSQSSYNFEFIGTISIKDGGVLSYKIEFNQMDNDEIRGFSVTDIKGENQTRTSIIGNYDTINNTLSFRELKNINQNSTITDSTSCFVSTKELKIINIKGSKFIKGNFKGLYASGEYCAEGSIYLIEKDIIKKIKSLPPKKKISRDSIRFEVKKQSPKKGKRNLVLKSNDKLLVEFGSKNIFMEIMDGYVEDGDMIDIYLNDQIFKEKVTLRNKKQTIKFPVTDGITTLKIVALNQGVSGNNTVNFLVKNNNTIKGFSSNLLKGESFEIEFKRF